MKYLEDLKTGFKYTECVFVPGDEDGSVVMGVVVIIQVVLALLPNAEVL